MNIRSPESESESKSEIRKILKRVFNVIHYSIVKPKYYMPTIHVCLSVCLIACLFTVCILFPHTLLIAIAYHNEYYNDDVVLRTVRGDVSFLFLFLFLYYRLYKNSFDV